MNETIPHDRATEEALVGSVLIDPALFDVLAEIVTANDFYIERLRWIWETYESLNRSGMGIDILTVSNALENRGRLNEIGGLAFLTSLLNQVPTTLNSESYAHLVADDSTRRKLLSAAEKMAAEALNTSLSIADVMARSNKHVLEVLGQSQSETKTVAQVMGSATNEQRFISTHFPTLDRYMRDGFASGELNLIAGRPGEGKSAIMVHMAARQAIRRSLDRHPPRIGIFSVEMRAAQLVNRMLANVAGVDSYEIDKRASLSPEESGRLESAEKALTAASIYIDDTPSLSPSVFRAKAHAMHRANGLDIIYLDYVQLMTPDSRSDTREQQVAAASRTLKLVARELDIPVVALAMVSRAVEQRSSREPTLADLRESGALEQDADTVFFIWQVMQGGRLYDKPAQVVKGKLAKNRNGRTGLIDFLHRQDLHLFVEAEAKP